MSTSLSIHVVAHEKRRDMAEHLAGTVQADHLWVDNGQLGEWKNHLRAWKTAAKSDATHAVFLQDDAVPVDDLRKHIEAALEWKPDDLISLYVGTHRPRREEVKKVVASADRLEASWIWADTLMWGVGVVVPVALIDEILETVKKSKLPYDQRIGVWAEETRRGVFYTWPSLVDHADEPTVIRGRGPAQGIRVAHKVGVPSWNDKIVHIRRHGSNFLSSTRDKG